MSLLACQRLQMGHVPAASTRTALGLAVPRWVRGDFCDSTLLSHPVRTVQPLVATPNLSAEAALSTPASSTQRS